MAPLTTFSGDAGTLGASAGGIKLYRLGLRTGSHLCRGGALARASCALSSAPPLMHCDRRPGSCSIECCLTSALCHPSPLGRLGSHRNHRLQRSLRQTWLLALLVHWAAASRLGAPVTFGSLHPPELGLAASGCAFRGVEQSAGVNWSCYPSGSQPRSMQIFQCWQPRPCEDRRADPILVSGAIGRWTFGGRWRSFDMF